MFLQSLLHSPHALLSRYRRWANKVSNLKIYRWFCSHCQIENVMYDVSLIAAAVLLLHFF